MDSKTFKIDAIGCNGCVATIKNELLALNGVTMVDGSVADKMITVNYEAPASVDVIVKTLVEIEYPPVEA
jgi:copper chaperone CopZ